MKISHGDFVSILKENVSNSSEIDVSNLSNIKMSDRLSDIGIDSLGFATLLWSIEEKLNIQTDDEYLESLNGLSTVSDLLDVFKALGHEIELELDTVK